ncbi:MAG TPA: type II secretion system protein GspJ [Phycisphaerae bacterium]|nr:type II secretion system protein GspJ [Phycisphaerae bacterium]
MTTSAAQFHPGTRRSAGAFTLLELMVALAIVAIITLALSQSIYSAFKAKSTAEAAMDPASRIGISMDFLVRDFSSALPPTGTLAYEFEGTDNGDQDDVIFFAPTDSPTGPTLRAIDTDPNGNSLGGLGGGLLSGASGGTGGGGMLAGLGGSGSGVSSGPNNADVKQVEYTIAPDDGGTPCLMRYVTSDLLADVQPDPDQEIICRGVQTFNVEYFDGTTWQTSWDSTATDPQNELPVAVRITLELTPTTPNGPVTRIIRVINLACYVDLSTTNTVTGN